MVNDKNSLQQYLIEGMKHELKQAVYKDILEELVAQFKSEIEPVLKERFEKISIESIENFRDMHRVTDEIRVLIKGVSDE